jgi:hypothetical protein
VEMKKAQKLAKNRMAAKVCREKKKVTLTSLNNSSSTASLDKVSRLGVREVS